MATSPIDPSVLPAITGIWLLASVKGEMTSINKTLQEQWRKNYAFVRVWVWIEIFH